MKPTDQNIFDELGLEETKVPLSTEEEIEDLEVTPEDEAAIDEHLNHPLFSILPKTSSVRKSLRKQLKRQRVNQPLLDTLILMQAEDVMAQEKEKRAAEEFNRREAIRVDNKFKELRYRKALDQGIADDMIRLEFGRERVVHDITPELTDMRRKNIESTKRVLALEAEIKKLKGE